MPGLLWASQPVFPFPFKDLGLVHHVCVLGIAIPLHILPKSSCTHPKTEHTSAYGL